MQLNWLQFVVTPVMPLDVDDMRRVWATNKPPRDVPKEWYDLLYKLDHPKEKTETTKESETC